MKKKAKKKKPQEEELSRWLYAQDSIRLHLVELNCQLKDLRNKITALTCFYNHSTFDRPDESKQKTKKQTK